jgi:hypothetical protein
LKYRVFCRKWWLPNNCANKAKFIPTKWLIVLLKFRGIFRPQWCRIGFCVPGGVGIEKIHFVNRRSENKKHQLLQNVYDLWLNLSRQRRLKGANTTAGNADEHSSTALFLAFLVPIVKVEKQVLKIEKSPWGYLGYSSKEQNRENDKDQSHNACNDALPTSKEECYFQTHPLKYFILCIWSSAARLCYSLKIIAAEEQILVMRVVIWAYQAILVQPNAFKDRPNCLQFRLSDPRIQARREVQTYWTSMYIK